MIRQAGVTLQTTGMFRKLLFWQPLERLAHALRCSLPLLLHTGIPPRCAAPMDSRTGQYARNVARPPSCSSSSTTMPRPPLFGLPVQTIYRQTMLHHPIDRHVDNGSSRLSEPCGPSRPRLPRGATPGSSFSTANAARTVIPARREALYRRSGARCGHHRRVVGTGQRHDSRRDQHADPRGAVAECAVPAQRQPCDAGRAARRRHPHAERVDRAFESRSRSLPVADRRQQREPSSRAGAGAGQRTISHLPGERSKANGPRPPRPAAFRPVRTSPP